MMARRISKLSTEVAKKMLSKKSLKWISCRQCSTELEVDIDTVSALCSLCVCYLGGAPKTYKPQEEKSDKPKGWAFMAEFVDSEGNVYKKGVEVPELKGTLPATDVEKIKKEQKQKSVENKKNKAERERKKEARLVKEHEKKQKEKKKLKEKKELELQKLSNSKL